MTPVRKETKLLSPAEVGAMLGFKPRTITKWCREGKIINAQKMGRVWRIVGEPIVKWLE
jgi:predicted site-specific integrase-resolvase